MLFSCQGLLEIILETRFYWIIIIAKLINKCAFQENFWELNLKELAQRRYLKEFLSLHAAFTIRFVSF